MRQSTDRALWIRRASLAGRLAWVFFFALTIAPLSEVTAGEPAPDPTPDPIPDVVAVDYPDELPLDALVDYVSQTLDLRIVYGSELQNQRVTLRPGHFELPRDRLLDLLRSVLQIRGLTLVETDLPGFYQVITPADVQRVTGAIRTTPPEAAVASGRVVTQVFTVPSGETRGLLDKIKPFTSSAHASLLEVPERGLIILTDYEPVVARIGRLIEVIGAAPEPVATEIVAVEHQSPDDLARQVIAVLDAEAPATLTRRPPAPLTLLADVLPGRIVAIGPPSRVERALALLAELDVARHETTPMRTYEPMYSSAARLKQLIDNLVLQGARDEKQPVHLFVDEPTNRLFVTAPPHIHSRVLEVLRDEDRPVPPSSRRLRIYRPRNRTAGEILDTLTQLLEEASVSFLTPMEGGTNTQPDRPVFRAPGPNRPPATPARVQPPPMPPAQEPIAETTEPGPTVRRIEGPDYVLTEDAFTNAIIAIGPPEFHAQLEELIHELDRRRPQVLIEMKLVAVSISDSLSLGIELEALELGQPWDYLLFTAFGLSEIDLNTGQRTLSPGVGANGVLISPKATPALFRALATHGDTKIISAPRLVVSDNATGTLRNVDEAPFTSVNASDTVATTSFAGFASAGTTLTVTPHVAEGDHLSLAYNLTFSSFSGQSGEATVPPPRASNTFSGELEVPDGYTVIVGGLTLENETDTVDEVPLLGRIPVLGAIFQRTSTTRTRSRVFAFIRPIILRDDQFADLKFISARALEEAKLENNDFPEDCLMWMD